MTAGTQNRTGVTASTSEARAQGTRAAFGMHAVLLLAAVALPIALAGLFAWSSWHGVWREARGEMERDSAAAAEYAGRLLDSYRQAAERVGDLLGGQGDTDIAARRPALEQSLRSVLSGLPDLEAAEVVGPEGAALLGVPAPPTDPRHRLLALLREAAPGTALIAPLPASAGQAFAVALPLGEGGHGGAICITVDSARLAARLGRMATGATDAVGLLLHDATLLARAAPPGTPVPSTHAPPNSPLAAALQSGVERGSGRGPSAHDGIDRLMAFRRVQGWPAFAIVARPATTIVARWREAVALPLLLGVASAAMLAVLGLLVRRNQHALQEANARLEQRVAERTVEVAQALAAMRAGDERLRLAVEAAGFGTWEIDLRSRTITRSGRAMMDLPDLPFSGFGIDAYLTAVHPEDRARVQEAIADLASGALSRNRAEYRVDRADGSRIWVESYGGVIERDEATGAPIRLAGVSRDVTDRRQAEAMLRASETRLRVAMEAARFGTWEYDVVADRGARAGDLTTLLPQVAHEGFPLAAWVEEIHPEDREALLQALGRTISGEAARMLVQFRVRRPEGGWASIESAGAVAERDPATGRVLRIAGVARDITEQHMAAQRQVLLAREVDHRAKNALAVVQAALRLTPKTDAASYAQAVEGRVRALARAHTLLADARWEGASLQALAASELAAFLPAPVSGVPLAGARVVLEGPELTLSPAAAQGLSMALHELATNATKYGALSAAGGRVLLAWEPDPSSGLLRLRWQESGGPPVPGEPVRRGFGSRVVEATVRDQLGGRLARDWQAGGLVCRIEIPLKRALVAPGGGSAATVAAAD